MNIDEETLSKLNKKINVLTDDLEELKYVISKKIGSNPIAISGALGMLTITSGGHIKGGQTAYHTGTGFFLGYSTNAYKLSIGNSASDYLIWDGTNIKMSGEFSAGSISIGTSPNWFKVDTSGNIWSGDATLAGAQTNTFAVTNAGIMSCVGANIRGTLNADDITAGTLTGRTFQTAASGTRVVIGGGTEWIKFYDASTEQAILYATGGDFLIKGAQTGSDIFLDSGSDGEVALYKGGVIKLATSATGITISGGLSLLGSTSGGATITVPAVAGTPTYVLPAAVGSAGQVLTDAAGDGILSWAAGAGGGDVSTAIINADFIVKNVIYGLLPAISGNLTSDISAGVAYINGKRVIKTATSKTYTASKDTYVDLNSAGTYTFVEVANGAAEPAITADSIRLAKVITDVDNITGFIDRRAKENAIYGYQAGSSLTTGRYNIAIGMFALNKNTTGYRNTANGHQSLYDNTIGYYNTANGYQSLYFNTEGYNNTAIGMFALRSNTTGYSNTAVGVQALQLNQTGTENIGLGYYAGTYETGSNAFYVNNQDRANTAGDKAKSILYGVMAAAAANQKLTINGLLNQSVSKTPAAANAAGTAGDICWDASYIYVCTATDTWKRVGIATW